MPASRCPRCSTLVAFELGSSPNCHVCAYPASDSRGRPQATWKVVEGTETSSEPETAQHVALETRKRLSAGKITIIIVSAIVGYVILVGLFGYASNLGGINGPQYFGTESQEKVGPASCQDEHIRITLSRVETRTEASSNEPITRTTFTWTSRDSFGEIAPPENDSMFIIAEEGQFTAQSSDSGASLRAAETDSFHFDVAGHAPAGQSWTSFAARYTVDNGHDDGESEGNFLLTCSLVGDNAPDKFLG